MMVQMVTDIARLVLVLMLVTQLSLKSPNKLLHHYTKMVLERVCIEPEAQHTLTCRAYT